MLAADVTEIVLAHTENDLAKPALIKMGASLTCAKLKVRRVIHRDALLDDRSVAALQRLIFLERFFVDINFPTDAAAVLAPVCYALKAFVICRGVEFHRGFL